MKKLLLPILLFMMFIPLNVFAEDSNICEQINSSSEKTINVNITQEIVNKENIDEKDINEFKFSYKILDLDNNVLSETTNDQNGNIMFSCFDVKASDIGDYKLYKIIMEENDNMPFDYDQSIIYFSLRPNYTNGLFDPIIAFYKDDGDNSPERYNTNYKGKVFHATEEELQGQAYAVLDKDTGILTFFRDEENKYTNKQEIGNKIYFTGFEEHQSKEWYSSWSGGWEYNYDLIPYIKKIVFKDAIKPNNITGWFDELRELEEIDVSKLDTSQLTGIDYFLLNCPKLKHVDISTFDTSKVNSLFKSFNNTSIEYLDFSIWNLNKNLPMVQMGEFGQSNTNLKYLNISNFGNWSSSAEFYNLPCLEKIVIGDDYDFYRSGFGISNDKWYNTLKNKTYTAREITNNLVYDVESMAGYYIRPMCTMEASFVSNYNPSKIKSSISIVEVDETEDFEVELEDLENVEYNKVVKFIIKPIEGYEVEKIIITDENDNVIEYVELDSDSEYEFTMPDTSVTIKPVYRKIQSINVPNTLKNPNTGDKVLIIMLLMIISLGTGTFIYKKKKRNYI